jgi:hypothetical protein
MRMKAPGAVPGRVGRCPSCGGRLRVPVELPSDAPEPREEAPAGDGYLLGPELEATVRVPSRKKPGQARTGQGRPATPKRPMADGLIPSLDQPERDWLASFLYPLRGAECLGVLAGLAVICWIFAVLVPEYCLTMMADAESMGAGILGKLFVVVCALPVVVLSPLVLSYWLQYLGRVLVSSAMGETTPPRSPDRNFDGFFHGLSPWFIWLVLGLGVGLLPLAWYGSSIGLEASNSWTALLLLGAGLPYVLMALMLSFLHDDPLAAKPWGVLGSLLRAGGSFWTLSGVIAAALGLASAAVAMTLWMRPRAFWLYLVLCLGCWVILHWTALVVMRLLGLYYFHRRDVLRWHRAHPRWGVAWRL